LSAMNSEMTGRPRMMGSTVPIVASTVIFQIEA
jgi:hypothetical protein